MTSLSQLLKLSPKEYRQKYVAFFRALNLTYPDVSPPALFSAPQPIRDEALSLFYQHARFDLRTSEHFVDFLSSISSSHLRHLRHISVRAFPFPVQLPQNNIGYTTYGFPSLPSLFPGLRLETLTVKDGYHGDDVMEDGWGHNATYYELGNLIREGKGWKKLIYRSPSDAFLKPVQFTTHGSGSTTTYDTVGRDPQPLTWHNMIKKRDGEEAGAGVEMWVCREGIRTRIDGEYQEVEPEQEEPQSEARVGEDEGAADVENNESNYVEVKVTRGQGADYVEDGSESNDELQAVFTELGWSGMKEKGVFIPGAEDDPTAHL